MRIEPGSVGTRWIGTSIAVFVVAFALRLTLAILFPNFGVAAPGEMERVATSWATTGQLANPYLIPTGPTAHLAPLYPMLFGSILWIFGTGWGGQFAMTLLSCVLAALRCALMIPLALVLGLGFRIAFLAAALSTFYISAFNTELRGWWEAPLCALLLVVLVMLAVRFYNSPAFTVWTAIGLGLFGGLALLVSPSLLPTLVVFLVFMGRPGWHMPKVFALWLTGLVLTAGLVLLPWTIRNARVLGSPIVFRSNLGLELSMAYDDRQRTSASDGDILSVHPSHNMAVSEEIARIGEVAFMKNRMRQATAWMESHPFATARLMAVHFWYFWFPPSENIIFRVILAGLTLFALAGLWTLYKVKPQSALLISLIWITFPLTYYVTYWSSRYRYPMEWTLVLCAAAFVGSLLGQLKPKAELAASPS
jgi:hypothetical protein